MAAIRRSAGSRRWLSTVVVESSRAKRTGSLNIRGRYLSKSPPSGYGRRPRRSVWPVARSERHEHQSSFFRRHDVSCLGHRRARCILRSDPSDQVRSDKTRRCGSCRTASPADFRGRAEVVCGRPRKCRRRLTYHYKVVTRSYRHDIASGGLPTFKTARQQSGVRKSQATLSELRNVGQFERQAAARHSTDWRVSVRHPVETKAAQSFKMASRISFQMRLKIRPKQCRFRKEFNALSPGWGGRGAVARLVGIEVGVVSGVFNLESPGVSALGWRLRHEEAYHAA